MKKLSLLAFCLLLAIARVASAQTPTPATFNPLPQQNASFFSALTTFLLGEPADRDTTWQSDYKIEQDGCRHPTAAGATGTFPQTCYAFIDGTYIIEPAASISYAALGATATDFCWVILTPEVNTAEAGFTRLGSTHYMGNCTAANTTRPTLAGPGMYVMGTTLTAGAITDVIDETSLAPTVWTYTDVGEVLGRADRIWRGPVDGSSVQVYCFSDDLGQCLVIPTGDSGGCAVCGDSATSFFSTGEIAPVRGGTGDNTSAVTGLPYIVAGNWLYETLRDVARGGTGLDNSAATGVQRYVAGTPSVQAFPNFRDVAPASTWGVDGAQCTKDDTGQFANSDVPVATVLCADNAAGRIAGTFRLPSTYDPNTAVSLAIVAVNNGTDVGVLGFDVTCLCASSGDAVDSANFAAALNIDIPFTGTQSQQIISSVSITCGGTCAVNDVVYWRGAVDDTATTISTPTDVKLLAFQLTALQTALGQ